MSEETRAGVKLDLCRVCFGVWFDGGEMEDYHEAGGSARLSDVPAKGDRYEPTGESAHVKCPRCESDILRHGRISRHRVMRCTSCRGLFLPNANSRFKSSNDSGILDSAIGVLEEIVGGLF
jgi:Zn-finger nucleic acid-binding protein